MEYLAAFFNSQLFRFCFKDHFPELLGDTRELRKVFFDTISIKLPQDEVWYSEMIAKIEERKIKGMTTAELEYLIDENFFDMYGLSTAEKEIIRSSINERQ